MKNFEVLYLKKHVTSQTSKVLCLLLASCWLLGILLIPEDGGSIFFMNVCQTTCCCVLESNVVLFKNTIWAHKNRHKILPLYLFNGYKDPVSSCIFYYKMRISTDANTRTRAHTHTHTHTNANVGHYYILQIYQTHTPHTAK
jgi:hypothetical protein